MKSLNKKELAELALLDKEIDGAEKLITKREEADPFWYFIPNDGVLTEDRKAILSRYLKEEDIPEKVDSQLDVLLSKAEIRGVSGGNRCLGGETEIYDPVKKKSLAVKDIASSFHVHAWNGEKLVVAKAGKPFVKNFGGLYRLTFSNGGEIVVSKKHRFLTPKGFLSVDELQEQSSVCTPSLLKQGYCGSESDGGQLHGSHQEMKLLPLQAIHNRCKETIDRVCQSFSSYVDDLLALLYHFLPSSFSYHHQTSLGSYPSVHALSGQNSWQKEQGFQFDYRSYRDSYDEQSHLAPNTAQDVFPSLNDAHGHNECVSLHKGGLDGKYLHNQPYRLFVRPSIGHDSPRQRISVYEQGEGYLLFQEYAKEHGHEDYDGHKNHKPFHQNQGTPSVCLPRDITPSSETSVIEKIEYLRDDDIYDLTVPVYHNYQDVSMVISSNSSKTMTETMLGVIKSTGELPEALKVYEEHFRPFLKRAHNKFVNGRVTGVDNKQLHRVVLPEWKKWIPRKYLKKGDWDASYSKEFDILTLYRAGKPCSNVEFLTNEQKVKSAQGGNLDWANFDEEPERAKYKETLMRFGTSDRLDIGIAWTPTEGLTWATDLFHHGIFTDDYGDESATDSDVELFKMTSVCNRFVQDTIIKIMDNYKNVSSYDEMKMRLLGEAISLSGLVYGAIFNRHIHVIPPFWSLLPASKRYNDYVVYRGLDPHMVKPSVAVEVAVDREGMEYVVGTYISNLSVEDECDVEGFKKYLAMRVVDRGYRLGWSKCDTSADSTIRMLGDRNIYLELGQGQNAVPALEKSQKFTGSIHRGVDKIKQKLREKTLAIEDIPENRVLINAMQTMERETYTNEDKKGLKDQIAEGKHDTHAALRYCHQRNMNWIEPFQGVPEPDVLNDAIGY